MTNVSPARIAMLAAGLLLGACAGRQPAPPPALPPAASAGAEAPQLRIEAGMHTATIMRISADAAGRYAVTASLDKTARVWELPGGRLLQVLRPPVGPGVEGQLSAVAMSPDGETVATGGNTGYLRDRLISIYLFDRASGRLRQRLGQLPETPGHLAFSPDGRYLAAVLYSGGLRVWPLADDGVAGAPMADPDYVDQSYAVAWSGNRLATSCYDGQVRLYQVDGGGLRRLASIAAPGGRRPYGLAFSPDGSELAVGYSDAARVDILDAATLAPRYVPDTRGIDNGNLTNVAWSADGASLLAGCMWHPGHRFPVRRWPRAGRGAPEDVPTSWNSIRDLHTLADGRILLASFEPAWGVLQPGGTGAYSWTRLGAPPIADARDNAGFAVSADAGVVQFSFTQWGAAPYRFDLARRQLSPGADPQLYPAVMEGLDLRDWRNSFTPRLAGQPLPLDRYEYARAYALGPAAASFALGAEWSLRYFDSLGRQLWRHTAPAVTWDVDIPPSGKVVVAAFNDGTIRWYRLADGRELLAFFAHADRQRWVLWTPEGYYDASPGGDDLLGWTVNRGKDQAAAFYPAGSLRERYHRPDRIDQVLQAMAADAVQPTPPPEEAMPLAPWLQPMPQ